jgi:NAD(P)-dependent dehydrogenase (short-subunit alcohol dehydrogenase family)
MRELDGKVAVVTGAASGIGAGISRRLAEHGMKVVLADIEAEALEGTAAELRDGGAETITVVTDVADPDAVDALADIAFGHFGAVHLVCNNAGVSGHLGRVWETPIADWRWVFDVNLFGIVNGVRAFTPRLIEQGEGHIVNTAAVVSWTVFPAYGTYAASKHAILALSEALRNELRDSGSDIGVSAFCPGPVKTRIVDSARNWPESLGEEPRRPGDEMTTTMYEHMVDVCGSSGMEPEEAADRMIEGVRANDFLIVTHPEIIAKSAEARLELARSRLHPASAD